MKKAGNKGEEKNTVNRGLVRPRFMDLSEFLGKFPLEDQTNKIEELIDVGAFITACTPSHIAERNIASDSLYYHEVRELYIAWKVQCRKFFKMDTKNFQNEYEIFSESDSIPLSIHVEKTDETYNSVSNEMLRDIATEIRLKLPILRDARAKIGRLYPETPSEGGVSELTVVGVIDGQGTYTLIVNKVYGQPIEKKMSNGSSGQLLYDLSDTKNKTDLYYYLCLSIIENFGFVILVPALLGIFLGLTLDNKFGTKPIATVISLTVGMILGFGAGIFQVKQFINKSKKT